MTNCIAIRENKNNGSSFQYEQQKKEKQPKTFLSVEVQDLRRKYKEYIGSTPQHKINSKDLQKQKCDTQSANHL